MSLDITSERSRKILGGIIENYIRTAEPVSSKAISSQYALGLSPATVRGIMAELEKEGYLAQPHTSAGRVPTDKGFRFYVDCLLLPEELQENEKALLKRSLEKNVKVESLLTEAARALSVFTGYAGMIFAPRRDYFTIKHIDLVRIDATSLIFILILNFGTVDTRIIRMGAEVTGLDLEKISNYLNSIAEGLTVRELRAKIVDEMDKEKNLYDELLAKALRLGEEALKDESAGDGELTVEGKVNILEYPEFRDDFDRMKKIFSAFEEKSLLVKILDRSLEDNEIHIYLGSESAVKEFEGLSFVTAPYTRDGEVFGTLGIIGPVRMNYSKIVPLVDYAAEFLSETY